MVFHWNLSDSKARQVARTLLSIPADLINSVVWMVSARSLISNTSSSFTKPLGIVQSSIITIGITFIYVYIYIQYICRNPLGLCDFELCSSKWMFLLPSRQWSCFSSWNLHRCRLWILVSLFIDVFSVPLLLVYWLIFQKHRPSYLYIFFFLRKYVTLLK